MQLSYKQETNSNKLCYVYYIYIYTHIYACMYVGQIYSKG